MKRSDAWGVLTVLGILFAVAGCGGDGGDDDAAAPKKEPSAAAALDGRLLFARFDESTHTFLSAHTARTDGSDEVEVPMPFEEGPGAWSRSGDEIAVLTQAPDGRLTTAIIDAEGKVLRTLELPKGSLNLVCGVWSPDDSRLACEGFDDADPSVRGVYTVRSSDGGDLVRLTKAPDGMADLPGDYSPEGGTFVFKRTTDEDAGALMTVSTDGGGATRLGDGDFEDAGRYSADGTTILTSAGGELVLLSTTGDEVGTISTPEHVLFGAVWSPDGSHIAYSDATGGPHADIFISLPDGSEKQQVTDTEDNEITLSWGAG
jgi:Tol biopolymer transport system component